MFIKRNIYSAGGDVLAAHITMAIMEQRQTLCTMLEIPYQQPEEHPKVVALVAAREALKAAEKAVNLSALPVPPEKPTHNAVKNSEFVKVKIAEKTFGTLASNGQPLNDGLVFEEVTGAVPGSTSTLPEVSDMFRRWREGEAFPKCQLCEKQTLAGWVFCTNHLEEAGLDLKTLAPGTVPKTLRELWSISKRTRLLLRLELDGVRGERDQLRSELQQVTEQRDGLELSSKQACTDRDAVREQFVRRNVLVMCKQNVDIATEKALRQCLEEQATLLADEVCRQTPVTVTTSETSPETTDT